MTEKPKKQFDFSPSVLTGVLFCIGYAAVSIFINKRRSVDIADMMSSLNMLQETLRQPTHAIIASPFEEVVPQFENLKKKINCPICFEDKLTEKTSFLACAHSICADCLGELREYSNRCPICRHRL